MNFKKIITNDNFAQFLLFIICSVFLLLLLKNPFSERNLISNLEPYPDTIHYISPALSFIRGDGLFIEREERIFKPTVPFLYSLVLIPGYLINDDARFFYITNIILAFSGFFFFYFFLLKITSNKFISLLVLFLYGTNYFVYWYPNLAMAENLSLTLFNAALFLFTQKVSIKNSIIAAFLVMSFYMTKYASFTLAAVFGVFYFIKLLTEDKTYRYLNPKLINFKKLKTLIYFLTFCIIFFLLFFLAEYLTRGTGIFSKIQRLIGPMLFGLESGSVDGFTNSSWFSYSYFDKNFQTYSKALIGEPMRFLWDFTPLLPKYIALFGILGLGLGIFKRNFRIISLMLIFFIIFPILFLSTFYTTDGRYIYHVIPTLLAGFGMFLAFTYKFLEKKNLKLVFYTLLIFIFLFYSFQNFYRLKYQVALNLRHAETPWNYMAVKNFNEYFSEKSDDNKPILITSLPPYYVDFLSNSNYQLLPLSTEQEFSNEREIVWGDEDYNDFIKVYEKYLSEDRKVFITNASLGNEVYLHRDFNKIKENFEVIEVKKGCFDACNIYELKQ